MSYLRIFARRVGAPLIRAWLAAGLFFASSAAVHAQQANPDLVELSKIIPLDNRALLNGPRVDLLHILSKMSSILQDDFSLLAPVVCYTSIIRQRFVPNIVDNMIKQYPRRTSEIVTAAAQFVPSDMEVSLRQVVARVTGLSTRQIKVAIDNANDEGTMLCPRGEVRAQEAPIKVRVAVEQAPSGNIKIFRSNYYGGGGFYDTFDAPLLPEPSIGEALPN